MARVAGVVAVLIAVLAAAPASAQVLLTPDGPATLRSRWLGPITSIARPPEVVVRWSLTVGAGGRAGRVRLRVLRPGDSATLVGSSQWESLPSEPGTYVFGLRPGIRYDYRDWGLAIEQQAGGHAIIATYPSQPGRDEHNDPFRLNVLDIFRPVLPDGAAGISASERIQGQGLRVRQFSEPDLDQDDLGDTTQDRGDLRVLRASVTARGRGQIVIRATVRNVGTTLRHLPRIIIPAGRRWECEPRSRNTVSASQCGAPALRPGAQAQLRVRVFVGRSAVPSRVRVASEGVDTHPQDNSIRPARSARGLLGPALVERGVGAAGRDQLVVRALFGDLAVVEHDDPSGLADR